MRRDGFTMLELMVALGLLAFGLLGVTAGQIMAMKLSSSSRDHTLAMYLAEQQMETLQASSGADVKALAGTPNDPANPIDPDPGDGVEMAFVRRRIIEADQPEAGVIRITIEVDWVNSLGNTQTARVQSFKADR